MWRKPSWSQKIEARNFQRIFALGIFWGEVSRYAATPLIVALSPIHSHMTRFPPWSPVATGNHLDRAEEIPNVAQTAGAVEVFDPRSGVLGRPERGASKVEKSPCLNWATQFLMVAYDDACSSNVSFRMARVSFCALPCRKKES